MSKKKSHKATGESLIDGLCLVAEQLGYSVSFRRVKAMGVNDIGLTCPDLNKIYLDKKAGSDVASTLAHEIGHIILMILRPAGHRDGEDTDFDNCVGENAADLIGAAICSAMAHPSDYSGLFEKATSQLTSAGKRYKSKELHAAFTQGYCLALSDVIPNSKGAEVLVKLAHEITQTALSQSTGKARKNGKKVQGTVLRFSRTHGSGVARRWEHRRGKNR
jgi:hypothetical protein